MSSSESDDIKYQKLRRFNLIMGFFHFIQAAIMLVIANYDVKMFFTTSFLDATGGFPPVGASTPVEFFSVPLGPMVAIFLLMSAIAHLFLATVGYKWYAENLKMNINKARWIEYAVSSSFMLVVIAWLCGMFDFVSVMLLFSLIACMNLFGYMMELHNQNTQKTDWTAFIFGCFAGLIPWVALFMYFLGVTGGSPPGFVYGIMISIAFFFNIFAVNMVLQYKKVGKWKDYLYGERFYIILSLVAKTALAWQVFAGTMV
ncbi:MAG: heliorhodopsin HeR [Candidatus Methanomethylophilaceae archaeon]|nr:heliorhodopsin HeR [Candidatus Methanomethylophilaceae archaeon]